MSIKFERLSDVTLGDRASEAGLWHKARRHYRRVLRRNPDNSAILVQYGHALKETGKLPEAEKAYRGAIACAPSTADSHLQLGHVLKLAGKLDDARAAYFLAFTLDPEVGEAARELTALGWPDYRLSRLAAALPAMSRAAPSSGTPQPALIAAKRPDDPLTSLVERLGVRNEVYGSPIHPQDNMCSPGREQHYYAVGQDALWNVLQSMMSAGLTDAGRILDFPSGFGCVTRYLRAAFPQVQIDVGDLWEAAVAHCAATYSTSRIEAKADYRYIDAPNYDVIFCGSLLTQLPEAQGTELLDFLSQHLEIGGVMVVTFCGRKKLLHEQQHFNALAFGTPENLERLVRIYHEGQYSFIDYPGRSGNGRAFVPVSWFQRYVAKNPQLIITRLAERSWDNDQDAVTFKRIF